MWGIQFPIWLKSTIPLFLRQQLRRDWFLPTIPQLLSHGNEADFLLPTLFITYSQWLCPCLALSEASMLVVFIPPPPSLFTISPLVQDICLHVTYWASVESALAKLKFTSLMIVLFCFLLFCASIVGIPKNFLNSASLFICSRIG